MSIPASQIVQVNPGVLAAAGSAVDLNGLILTERTDVPIGTMQPFASAADVGAYFGLSSDEYAAAAVYFAGPDSATKTPARLYFAQYNDAAVPAYLRSGSLSSMTLTQLQALSGTLTINADGTPLTSSSISLSAASSFSDAATIIEAAFTSPGFDVTYDAQHAAFVFTNATDGTASTQAFASGTLAAGLKLTSATGAVVSQGAAIATPATTMAACAAAAGDWAAFTTTWEPELADKILFSAWTTLQNDRYVYAGFDSDVNALTAGSTATWGYAVAQANDSGTVLIYGALAHAAFVLGVIASTDFSRANGRTTLAFQKQTGIAASVSNGSDASALLTNGYNFYGAYATSNQGFTFFYNGSISGPWKWVDSFINQIWLNAQLQQAMFVLLQSVGSIPYNAEGYALIDASILDPVNAAINFGAIRTGVALSSSQVAQLRNAIGADVSGALNANGYYLQILPATAQIRVDRASPAMTLYYTDGGSVQQLTLASIEIQ